MPHRISVTCPNCRTLAQFEFAEAVKIDLSKDVEYFKKSDAFEYRFFEGSSGNRWHGAIFFHGLKRTTLASVDDLPEGYAPEDWNHNIYLYGSHAGDMGTVVCASCDYRRKHDLRWPQDAYFQIDYKGKALWAFNRESAVELLGYIGSEDRKRERSKWRSFLRHVPSHFLLKTARETVTGRLKKLLQDPASTPH